jgi:hypothetical protein
MFTNTSFIRHTPGATKKTPPESSRSSVAVSSLLSITALFIKFFLVKRSGTNNIPLGYKFLELLAHLYLSIRWVNNGAGSISNKVESPESTGLSTLLEFE